MNEQRDSKPNILFVDDEERVLDGLRRMLRPLRKQWRMAFANNASEALETLTTDSFQVIVSDIRMPGMDGGDLLNIVKRDYPQTVRVVLSGYADKDAVLRLAGTAHQYLSKPCEPDAMRSVLARSIQMSALLSTERLRKMILRIDSLPSLPAHYLELIDELKSSDASVSRIEKIMERDMAMSSKVLQLVNSAFFGLRRRVSNTAQAVNLLGLETLRALVFAVHVFQQFEISSLRGLSIAELWDHSMNVAALARKVAESEGVDKQVVDDAFISGLLHDAGKLAIAAEMPEEFVAAVRLSNDQGLEMTVAESQAIGATHAEAGAYLLGMWGLPGSVVSALAFHHAPNQSQTEGFTALTAVHVANCLANEISNWTVGYDRTRLETDYIKGLGLTDRIPVWQELLEGVEEGSEEQ